MKVSFTGITFGNSIFLNKNQKANEQNKSVVEYNNAQIFPKILKENFIASRNISFGGFACSPDTFDLKKLYGLNCPCCGKLMPTSRQMQAFAQRIEGKTGDELQKELVKGLPYYRTNEEEIANILIEATEEHPRADLQKLVSILAVDSKGSLEEAQKRVIEEIRTESETLDEVRKKELKTILDDAIYRIDNSDDEKYFKRNAFVSSLMDLKEKHIDEDHGEFDKIIEIAQKLPKTYTSKDAFFVKYQRKTTKEIALRLFSPAIGTTEHAKPKSKEGENNTKNYIPMCSDCNFHRGNMPYNEWFKIHPEMPENLQNYIDWIDQAIRDKQFKNSHKYETYVDEIIQTIKEETEGALVLKKPAKAKKAQTTNTETEEEITPVKSKTIEEQRAEWEKEAEHLQQQHDELVKIKKALDTDEEFLAMKEYVKESAKLNALNKEKNDQLSEVSRLASLKSQQKANVQDAIKENKKQATIRELEDKLNKTTKQHEKAKEAYQEILGRYNAQKQIVDELKKKVELPDEIQGQITGIRNRISTMDSMIERIKLLKGEVLIEDDLIIIMSNLNKEINAIERRMAKRAQNHDLDSEDNKQALKDYLELQEQVKTIDNISMLKFKKLFGGKNVEPPMFILNEAKNSLFQKIEATKKFPLVQQYIDGKDLAIKKEEKTAVTSEYDIVQAQKRELKDLTKRLSKMKQQADKSIMLEEIDRLGERKNLVKYKFRHIDIDSTIKSIEDKIADIWQKYTDSFESDY